MCESHKSKMDARFFVIISLMSALVMHGCASMRPRSAVPIDFSGKVSISGMPDIRSDIDNPDPIVMQKSLTKRVF